MATIKLENLVKTYGEVKVLHNVNGAIKDGELVVVVGPSGCGKTTLLSILGGFIQPTHGEVWIGSRDMTNVLPAKRPTTTMFQDYALFPHMSLRDNVSFGLRMAGKPRRQRYRLADEKLDLVGLKSDGSKRPHELSGGQRQRVVIARALARHPDILICDEPVSALDAPIQARVLELLATLQARLGMAIVLVSHDLGVVARYCHDVMVMRDGAVIESGPTQKIVNNPGEPFTRELLRASAVDLA